MQRNIIVTKDGSHSVEIPALQVSYHSVHGAIQESMHVFIEAGLRHWFEQHSPATRCNIFEMGFGTGLNALLTLAHQPEASIIYQAVEAFPLENEMINALNYCEVLQQSALQEKFQLMHNCGWNESVAITDHFNLKKISADLLDYHPGQPVDIIYYDAFAPAAQPELWTLKVFERLYTMLTSDGILVTYCSKGAVRRALQEAGFLVEKLPGPPGKREMLRAIKPVTRMYN